MNSFLRYLKNYIFITHILFLSYIDVAVSQENRDYIIPDSLSNKSYEYLFDRVSQNRTDTIPILNYLNAYLTKAIKENNSFEKLSGYIYLSYYTQNKKAKLDLINKAIVESKDIDDQDLIQFYTHIGTVYYYYFDYEIAMKNYAKALKIAEKYNKKEAEYILINNIALIKTDIGKYDEALSLYKKCYAYETLTNDTIGNIGARVNIAESMRNNKMYDSASYYYQNVVERAYQTKPRYGHIATINEGINLFIKENYQKAEILLLKGYSQIDHSIEGQKYYILATLYLGKIQHIYHNNQEKAKAYFIKVDSLVSKTKTIIPKTIEAYEFLINYYKKKGNIKEQLDIVIKLSQLKTTITSKKINTADLLHSEFDMPQLLKSKEALILKLEQEATFNNNKRIYLIIFILVLLIVSLFQYVKHKAYKKRFNKIVSQLNKKEPVTAKYSHHQNTPLNDIDQTKIFSILKKLNQFEENKGFLQNDLTLPFLAKKCNTNTKYLPKIINHYKHKPFVLYINDLRIDYILKELKENTILQKYKIKTISEEAGFNTAESFSRAFKNKTGIRPSYYIKNLKK